MRNLRNFVYFDRAQRENSERELCTVSWENLLKKIKRDSYLTFVQSLISLLTSSFADKSSRKLSLLTAECFILTLVIPGAKRCEIFEEALLQTIITLPKYIEEGSNNLSKQDMMEFKISLLTILEDLQFLFKHVSLEEFHDLRTSIFVSMKNLILFYYQNGYKNTTDCSLTGKAYEVLKDVCAPLHGDITKNLMKIFSVTSVLHNYSASGVKENLEKNLPHADSISGFFIYLLEQFPTNTTEVLTNFIHSTLSNPEENIRAEQYSASLEIAVKYEKSIFETCNISIVPYLEQLVFSEDAGQRANGTDFLSRIALINYTVNWKLPEEENAKIPREIHILRLLLMKTIDVNNNVKLKALSGLTRIFSGGNRNCRKILKEIFQSPEIAEKSSGIEELLELAGDFPNYLYHLLENQLAHVRKNALALLEHLVTWNEKLLDTETFFEEITRLVEDSSSLVRRQVITTVNALMRIYPQKERIIKGWTKCILRLMRDNDAKIVEAAMESLKVVIFDNIERHEDSSGKAAQMPWITLRTMLQQEHRGLLRNAMDSWIKSNIVTQKTLAIIESHTNTENATEAWLLLSLVSGKMTSKNPDIVVTAFLTSIQSDSSGNLANEHFMLEIIHAWMKNFSPATINHFYITVQKRLSEGNLPTSLISPLYNICLKFKQCTDMAHDKEWIVTLNGIAEDFIWSNRLQLTSSEWEINRKMTHFLYVYSETSVDLPQKPRQEFLELFYRLIRESRTSQTRNPEKCCCLVIFTTRLALRDSDIAAEVVPELGKLLRSTQHKSIACNIIVALTDLCKKHTTLTEPIMQEVVSKLKASVSVIRYKALAALTTLVMQDYIKMRGRLLMNVLAAIVDRCRTIARAAAGMVLKYVEEKNRLLLQTSFLEVIYVYNGYMYERFEVFNSAEMDNEVCPLQGKTKRHLRLLLYRFFMQNLSDLQLLMFLNNVALTHEKIHKELLIKTPESVEALHDLLEVFTRVCEYKSWAMLKSASGGNSRDPDDLPDDPSEMELSAPIAGISTEEGGSQEKDLGTLKQAVPVLDKMVAILPKFAARIEVFDGSLKEKVDSFCDAVCENFKSFVEYAQPEKFWKRYRDAKRSRKSVEQRDKFPTFKEEDEDFDL
ncbi:Condensin-2 complex subunit [Sergentomyia squamirostris]